jgi:hypothetical protein
MIAQMIALLMQIYEDDQVLYSCATSVFVDDGNGGLGHLRMEFFHPSIGKTLG